METVRDILKPLVNRLLGKSRPDGGQTADDVGGTNKFANLEVEEVSETDDGDMVSNNADAKTEIVYRAELPNDRFDLVLGLHCMLQDLHALRDSIEKAWLDYRRGETSLIGATMMTNAAINVGRQLIEEFEYELPKERTLLELRHIHFKAVTKLIELDDENEVDLRGAKNVFLHTGMMIDCVLEDLAKAGDEDLLPYTPDDFKDRKILEDREDLTPKERYQADQAILWPALSGIRMLQLMGFDEGFKPDEITKAFWDKEEAKNRSMWLDFVAQAFLDIHECLGDDVSMAYAELTKHARYVHSSLQEHFRFHKGIQSPNQASNDQSIRGFTLLIAAWVQEDLINDFASSTGPGPFSKEPFWLFKAHPLLCGG